MSEGKVLFAKTKSAAEDGRGTLGAMLILKAVFVKAPKALEDDRPELISKCLGVLKEAKVEKLVPNGLILTLKAI